MAGRDIGGVEQDVGGGIASDEQETAGAREGPGVGRGFAGLGIEASNFHVVMWGLVEGLGFAKALAGTGLAFGIEEKCEVGEEAGLGDGFGDIALAEGHFEVVTGLEGVGEVDGGHNIEEGDGFGEVGGVGSVGLEILSQTIGQINANGIIQGAGIAGGEKIANKIDGLGGVVKVYETGSVASDIGVGRLADICNVKVGGSGFEEGFGVGDDQVRSAEPQEDEVGFIALESKADHLISIAGAAKKQKHGGLIGQVGVTLAEGHKRGKFFAENGFDDIIVKVGNGGGINEGGTVGMEIEKSLIGGVGDTGDKSVEGG